MLVIFEGSLRVVICVVICPLKLYLSIRSFTIHTMWLFLVVLCRSALYWLDVGSFGLSHMLSSQCLNVHGIGEQYKR